ncbi:unnamed protein product [Echinostoma caproni]|uniref:Ovule protein n=1 Tax=Echinostoma caproni TaxID=27848 RepID=A0A183A4W3_9TREM|nr:unnamed protein product [Echinostoma caproni]
MESKTKSKSKFETRGSDEMRESEYMCTREWRQHFWHDPEVGRNEKVLTRNPVQGTAPDPSQGMTSSSTWIDKPVVSHRSEPVISTKMAHGGYYEGDLSLNETNKVLLSPKWTKVSKSTTYHSKEKIKRLR